MSPEAARATSPGGASHLVGVDVGGTFTDVCIAGPDGRLAVHKTPTTPDIVTGVLDGLRLAAAAADLDPAAFLAAVDRFGHGSTVAVNALLERRLARTGLLTTRGFGDTLWIARMMAMTTGLPPEEWTHYRRRQRPAPPVERGLVAEVEERVDLRGEVLVALDPVAARQAVSGLLARGIEALAICTLWSFRNPVHERMLAAAAAEAAPELYVSVSCDVAPVLKEYERMATTAVNAALGPVVRSYLSRMSAELARAGLIRDFFVLNSAGGVIPPEEAAQNPVQLLGSGPSGGVLAAQHLAAQLGLRDVVTADMGGTSFDVGLIVDGEPLLVGEAAVGNLNLLVPMIDVRSIGAGGGSIAAAVDGALQVGPRSAGATPGPACYGRGGTAPTTTDADLVLGYIDPAYFLGGRMALDAAASADAIRRDVAEPLGMSVPEAAAGIREVADQRMADLLRQATIERGYDPRSFTLVAYGGAGPLHAASFAAAAGMARIVVPLTATAFSAHGILGADLRVTRQRSVLQRAAAGRGDAAGGDPALDGAALDSAFEELEADALRALARYGGAGGGEAVVRRAVRMRYARQVHDLVVPVAGPCAPPGAAERLMADFERLYAVRYGAAAGPRQGVIEVTTCLVQVIRPLPRPRAAAPAAAGPAMPHGSRRVFLGRWTPVEVYRWEALAPGVRLAGPALVDGAATTVWVPPGMRADVDDGANLILEAGA